MISGSLTYKELCDTLNGCILDRMDEEACELPDADDGEMLAGGGPCEINWDD